METYAMLKHSHMLFAVISISLFIFRAGLKFSDANLLQHKVLKITPHINDTLLLATGLTMAMIAGLSPGDNPWLATKLVLLVVYIVLGFMVIKRAMPVWTRGTLFVIALICFAAIGSSAVSKTGPFGLY